jgi:hypothetical protein
MMIDDDDQDNEDNQNEDDGDNNNKFSIPYDALLTEAIKHRRRKTVAENVRDG